MTWSIHGRPGACAIQRATVAAARQAVDLPDGEVPRPGLIENGRETG
jgi:hypothetical protein